MLQIKIIRKNNINKKTNTKTKGNPKPSDTRNSIPSEVPIDSSVNGQEFVDYIRNSNQLENNRIKNLFTPESPDNKKEKNKSTQSKKFKKRVSDLKFRNPLERVTTKKENTPADWTRRIMGL